MRMAFVSLKFEPSHFEDAFATQANTIRSKLVEDVTPFEEFLRACDEGYGIMDDTKFTERMKLQEMHTIKKIKRFLLGLNHALQSDGELINENRCTVEHILPQSKDYWLTWKGFDGYDPSDWVHRIGNLTLLGLSDNKPGGWNQSFRRKKPVYRQSAIILTRELDRCADWLPDEINARQEKLIQQAVKVWSF